MATGHQRKQMVTLHQPEGFALIPVDALPEPSSDVSVTPWSEPTADDWMAPHVHFSFSWDERYAGMSVSDVTAEACTIAARLLTEAGHSGAATLHPLPLVDLRFEYLVRPLSPAVQ